MPVIVIGADTRPGTSIVDELAEKAAEVRVFITDPDAAPRLRAMGANRRQIFFKVRLPGALPSFFSGFKIAITYSVVGAVIGEWVGASRGLGIFMIRSSKNFLTDRVFAAIAVTSLLSIIMFIGVIALERLLLPWYYARREEVWEEV